jgi:hypothetical protein
MKFTAKSIAMGSMMALFAFALVIVTQKPMTTSLPGQLAPMLGVPDGGTIDSIDCSTVSVDNFNGCCLPETNDNLEERCCDMARSNDMSLPDYCPESKNARLIHCYKSQDGRAKHCSREYENAWQFVDAGTFPDEDTCMEDCKLTPEVQASNAMASQPACALGAACPTQNPPLTCSNDGGRTSHYTCCDNKMVPYTDGTCAKNTSAARSQQGSNGSAR